MSRVQVSAGRYVAWLGATTSGATVSGSNAETDFALQIGGGVDAMVRRNLGLRLAADYRRIFFPGFGENEFRLVAGLALPFGK